MLRFSMLLGCIFMSNTALDDVSSISKTNEIDSAGSSPNDLDEYAVTCYICVNVSDNIVCNQYAIDRPCKSGETFCHSLHIMDAKGTSVLVNKKCTSEKECQRNKVGCVEIDTRMICISCCDQNYCNEHAPTNSSTAVFDDKITRMRKNAKSLFHDDNEKALTTTMKGADSVAFFQLQASKNNHSGEPSSRSRMNNQFVVSLQSDEGNTISSINSGMLSKAFKIEKDDPNDIGVLNDKDIIILNDNEFSLVPTSLAGDLVNYNLIDKIEPIVVKSNEATPTTSSIATSGTIQQPLPTTPTTSNHLPLPPSTTPTTCTVSNDPAPPQTIFTLPANPLVPISTTVTTNAQNETVTTTNYEIVNPVSIPDVDGAEPLFAGVFDATFSDEQMQQLLDATAITVADGIEITVDSGVNQQVQSLQLCNQQPPTHHPALRDLTNTLNNGVIPINAHTVSNASAAGLGLPFGMQPSLGAPNGCLSLTSSGIAEGAFGADAMADYGMFIKSEGMASLADFDAPHFIKQRYVDGKQSKIWQCGVCEKEFGHQYVLMRHLPTHTDERKFQCTVCGKAFRQMSTLSQHRAIHSADRPYICEICDKTFNRVSTLISHRKTHTGLKPHQCHLCNKAFHQKGNLRNHIFTHTNERPYKCDVCQKGFNQMSNLMCHKLKAHKRADKPMYYCQTCGKEFQKRMGLRNHEQYEHGDNGNRTGNPAQRIKYTNGVLIDRINTAAMQLAIDTNEIPFALLRPLNGIPVLVRALPAGEKQLLVPATADDLKRHGHITIGGKPNQFRLNQENNGLKSAGENVVDIKSVDVDNKENKSSKVQIRIPVVATVVQRMDKDGIMRMDVQSPGPTPIENYVPHEMGTLKSLLQSEPEQDDSKDNDIIIEATTLAFESKPPHVVTADDNMDVEEPSTSLNRIIERSLPKKSHQSPNNDSGISGYFDLTTNPNDSMNDNDVVMDGSADGKKSGGDTVGQFDSGLFSGGDRDQTYCEMFEILRKADDITAVDLTGDENSITF